MHINKCLDTDSMSLFYGNSYTSAVGSVDLTSMRKYRVKLLQDAMKKNGIDAYIATYPSNFRYVTDYIVCPEVATEGGYYSILFPDGDPYLVPYASDWVWAVDRINWIPKENIIPGRGGIAGLRTDPQQHLDVLENIIKPIFKKKGFSRGKLAVDTIAYNFDRLMTKHFPSIEIVTHQPLLEARAIKCEEEIKLMKIVCSILNTAAKISIDAMILGNRECDVAAEAQGYWWTQNIDYTTHIPQVDTGVNCTPSYFRTTTDRVLEMGDPWYFDYGVWFMGYTSTISSFGDVGIEGGWCKPRNEQREIYKIVYDALQAALKKMNPGVTTREVWAAGAKIFEEAGYAKEDTYAHIPGITFDPGAPPTPGGPGMSGCSVGTLSHEYPVISRDGPAIKLEEGMVFRVTPQWFKRGVGGGRIKNMVVVRRGGPEIITKTLQYGAKIYDYP